MSGQQTGRAWGQRGRGRRAALIGATALLLLGVAGAARAQGSLSLRSSSYVRGFIRPGLSEDTRHVPFYELVQLRATDLGKPGLTVEASLWGALGDLVPPDEYATGDVNLLFVQYRSPAESRLQGLELRVGRHFVAAGLSVLDQLDGASVDYRPPWGLRLTGFGGLPTGVRFVRQPWPVAEDDVRYGGSWLAGGRLGFDHAGRVSGGVSYRHFRFDRVVAHDELGWDLLLSPLERLQLLSDGTFELVAERLKEAQGLVRAELSRAFDLAAGYRFRSPDLFLPRSSIFAVFTDAQHHNVFGELSWAPGRRLSATLELGGLVYGETCVWGALGGPICDGNDLELSANLRGDLRLGRERQHHLTLEIERQGAPDGGLTRLRLGGRGRLLAGLSAIADADLFWLDEAQAEDGAERGHAARFSFAFAAHLAYAFRPDLSLLAGGQLMTTPLYSSAASFLVRLEWLLDRSWSPRELQDAVQGAQRAPAVQVARGGFGASPVGSALLGGGGR